MKSNQIASFLTALTVTSVLAGFAYLCISLLTFDLAGGQTLSEVDNQNIGRLFVFILILFISIIFARSYFKNDKRSTAYGIVVMPMTIVLTWAFYLVTQINFPTKFDKVAWEQSKWKPDDMAKSLVRQKTLIGLTREEVKQMLGEGSNEYGTANFNKTSIEYLVKNNWTLLIFFDKDKVVETELRLPFLGV